MDEGEGGAVGMLSVFELQLQPRRIITCMPCAKKAPCLSIIEVVTSQTQTWICLLIMLKQISQ